MRLDHVPGIQGAGEMYTYLLICIYKAGPHAAWAANLIRSEDEQVRHSLTIRGLKQAVLYPRLIN